MRRVSSAWIVGLCAFLALLGCGDDDGGTQPGPSDGPNRIVLSLENFGDPAPYHYALWALDGGAASLVTRFTVLDGAPVSLAGLPIASIEQTEALGAADALLITLESDTLQNAPGSYRAFAGAVAENEALLVLSDASALGVSFQAIAGTFLFDTPTTATVADCGRGVWWTDGAGAAGLVLPTLGSGWAYEGWAIDRDTGALYSTGRFKSPSGADGDGAGATAGGGEGYAFPGQDFVSAAGSVPVLEVDDGSFGLAVTLEPDPDLDAETPFITLLETNAGSGNLDLQVSTLPRLPSGSYYEIWAAFPDTQVSMGKFLYVNRKIVDVETEEEIRGFPIGCNLLEADAIRISVETESGPPEPSGSFVLAGTLTDGEATLTTEDALALGHAYTETNLGFILETPSTASAGDFRRGIWFYQTTGPETTSTLPLPEAPPGWRYQGWIVRVFAPTDTASTGTFISAVGADADGAGPYAGPDGPIPGYPGQDFVSGTVRDLDNGTFGTILSIEPAADGAPLSPFLVLFEDNDIDAVGANTTQPYGSLHATLPTGAVAAEAANRVTMESRAAALPRARVVFGAK
jgi:hypothetical protein